MKMKTSEEIRRRQMPQTFQEKIKWFANGFHQPKTRREISAATIDAFQATIWDKPFDDLLPTYDKFHREHSKVRKKDDVCRECTVCEISGFV